MNRLLTALAILVASASAASAQVACPSFYNGLVLTVQQWQACFDAKQNALGYTPVNKAGDSMTGTLTVAPSTSGAAGLVLPQGAVPVSPTNGAIWTTSVGVFARINGTTVGPFASVTGAVVGPGSSTDSYVPQWNGTSGTALKGGLPVGPTGTTSLITTDSSGQFDASVLPAFTGDVTTSIGTSVTTIGAIGGHAVSLAGPLTLSGAHSFTGTLTGNTSVTFPISGTLVSTGPNTFVGEQTMVASATTGAGFTLPPGVAPSSPVDGDIWTTTSGLYARINGVTNEVSLSGGAPVVVTSAMSPYTAHSGEQIAADASGGNVTIVISPSTLNVGVFRTDTTSANSVIFNNGTSNVDAINSVSAVSGILMPFRDITGNGSTILTWGQG